MAVPWLSLSESINNIIIETSPFTATSPKQYIIITILHVSIYKNQRILSEGSCSKRGFTTWELILIKIYFEFVYFDVISLHIVCTAWNTHMVAQQPTCTFVASTENFFVL